MLSTHDPSLPAALRADWRDIARPTPDPPPYDPQLAAHLPAVARRWLDHAIAPGTPLCRRAELRQRGQIHLGGRWRRLTARQALDPLRGFVWPVTTRVAGLPVVGVDRLSRGSAEMTHRVLGLLPVVRAVGPDLVRSAAARAASEICLCPAAALDPRVRWREVGERRVVAIVPVAGEDHEVTLTLDPTGALRSATVPRWASVAGGPWQVHTFGVRVLQEGTFGGMTVPRRIVGGYGDAEDYHRAGAFVRLAVEEAVHL